MANEICSHRYGYHARVAANLQDMVHVLHHCLNIGLTGDSRLAEEATKTFHVSRDDVAVFKESVC